MTDRRSDSERVDLKSVDVAEQKRQELLRLFPEARTEGGTIDFDRLKLTLGAAVDVGKERYALTWPGKADCFRTILTPSTATLRPMREHSIEFDTTENLLIKGDNLEVLKLLQKAYLGKVKMIYIDPPYNTGNDFIYPDNYTESLQTYLEYTGQVDSEGKKFSTNTESDGRFHSKWLNMMYPRLYLARHLLARDGVLFVSIDDGEFTNLIRMLDEIFGEEHRLACITVVSNLKGRSDDKYFATAHNYLIAYGGEDYSSRGVPLPEEYWDDYPETAADGRRFRLQGLRKRGAGARRVDRPNMFFPIFVDPRTQSTALERSAAHSVEVLPKLSDGSDGRWRWGAATVRERINELTAVQVGPDQRWDVFQIDYAESASGTKRIKPKTVWLGPEFSNEAGNLEVKRLFGKAVFDTAKPTALLEYCMEQSLEPNDIVLDFFAGSGTTAHAVLNMNAKDGGNRTFVLVQLPEPIDGGKYSNLFDLCAERVRKAIEQLADDQADKLDLSEPRSPAGFRAFTLDESNLLAWDSDTSARTSDIEQQLLLHVHHLRAGRTDDDLLFEILLKEGFAPTTRSEMVTVATEQAHSLAEGALVICLSRALDLETIRAIADRGPQRVVCLDEGFAGNDQLKANAAQIFKAKGIVFRTI